MGTYMCVTSGCAGHGMAQLSLFNLHLFTTPLYAGEKIKKNYDVMVQTFVN